MTKSEIPVQKLGDFATITMGASTHFYSTSEIEGATKSHLLIGACLDSRGNFTPDRLNIVWESRDPTRYVIRAGDILVMARGNIRATVVTPEIASDRIIASANFAIVRLTDSLLNPEYVAELLNTRNYLERIGLLFGTAIPSVSASALRNALIPILPHEQQDAVAELRVAREKAYTATVALAEQHATAADTLIEQLIWGES